MRGRDRVFTKTQATESRSNIEPQPHAAPWRISRMGLSEFGHSFRTPSSPTLQATNGEVN